MDPASLPLRDIHLPPPPGWWPPAPGWWLLLLLGTALCGLAWWWYRRYRSRALLRAARRALAQLESRAAAMPASQLVAEISMLLRRLAINFFPRARAAGLTGEAWLRFLDEPLPERPFSGGPGRILIEAPYSPRVAEIPAQTLLELCRRWIDAVAVRGRGTDRVSV